MEKYNDWTILEYTNKRSLGRCKVVLCQCKCGLIKEVQLTNLINNRSKRCRSCASKETSKLGEYRKQHGDSSKESEHYKIYSSWKAMKSRCYRKYASGYHRYGGRGIEVCHEWLDNYMNFKSWALMNGWKNTLTIDRIDVDGDYSPDNCRWVTHFENTSNMSLYHFDMNTGGHSSESILKRKISNTKNYGVKVLITNLEGNVLEFLSIKSAAEWLSNILDRDISSVYSQAKQCCNIKSKCKTVGGYYVSRKT